MTTADTLNPTATPARTSRRGLHVTLWVVQIVLAAFLVAVALPKLAGQQAVVEAFAKIGLGQWLRYLTGSCELAGAIGLLIPRLRGLAAIGLVGLMIGATITNLAVEPATAPVTVLLGVVFAWIAWQRREETKVLFRTLRR
jgi:putative oxidoreductase